MTNGLNIISKLNFEKLQLTSVPDTFVDDNYGSTLQWYNYTTSVTTPSIIENINDNKFITFNDQRSKIYSGTIYNINNNNFEIEFDIIIDLLKADIIVLGFSALATESFKLLLSSNANNGIRLICGTVTLNIYYEFIQGIKYNIGISRVGNEYSIYVDGLIVGYTILQALSTAIASAVSPSSVITLGASHTTLNSASSLYGKIGNFNFSSGNTIKHTNSYTKYGNNLISHLRFSNMTSDTYRSNVEVVDKSNIWTIPDISYTNVYGKLKGMFATLSNSFRIDINYKKLSADNNKFVVYGDYIVEFKTDYINTDPIVNVNNYTTAAIDFENTLTDNISSTIWQKSGTADITTFNKIFGNTSFETKALGDSLYTNSNIITGGATPFTIEFYALIKDTSLNGSGGAGYPLFNKNNNVGGGDQSLSLNNNMILGYTYYNNAWVNEYGIGNKIFKNEINKYTLSYDGVALRAFVDNKLCFVHGRNIGINTNVSEPYRFLRNLVPSYPNDSITTYGIIDNINIYDGIATKVRDPDPYEEFLVIDLAFDGENNSTKIVDNGTLKSNWVTNGAAKISTTQKFDGFSSLYAYDNVYTNSTINLENLDFTISFNFLFDAFGSAFNAIFTSKTGTATENRSQLAHTNYGGTKRIFFEANTNSVNIFSIAAVYDWQVNIPYKIDIIRKDNNLFFYKDGILLTQSAITVPTGNVILNGLNFGNFDWSPDTTGVTRGYIKNFKIYKGVAVIPESPVGKIQLAFDNNVTDKYNNSTWTNNGLVFDQINSVKGHSAKADGTLYKNIYSNSLTLNLKNNIYDFDFKVTDVDDFRIITSNKYLFIYISKTNANVYFEFYNNAAWITGYTSNVKIELNKWYNLKFVSLNDKIFVYINDIICDVIQTPYINLTTVQDIQYISGTYGQAGYMYSGYIDNFRFENNTVINIDNINKPAVHLPLETNPTNIGFSALTINSVGSPIYTTVDSKKCIKFESGKYLTINSNNIFNLGTSSDFYIEFDYYTSVDKYQHLLSGATTSTSLLSSIAFASSEDSGVSQVQSKVYVYLNGNSVLKSDIKYDLSKFNNVKLYRISNILYLSLNGVVSSVQYDGNINFSVDGTRIGNPAFDNLSGAVGYMSNFKMFVGTSEIPETYNDKKVLSLDFKPTRKSYLFKDNNNKCVIHPVNITQRDYQDSKYCCYFNGTTQYLQLGKNDLLNFGNDDCIIEIKFKPSTNTALYGSLISNVNSGYMSFLMVLANGNIECRMSSYALVFDTTNNNNKVIYDTINTLTFKRSSNRIVITLNDNIIYDNIVTQSFNLNDGNNTYIGTNSWDGANGYYKGYIYSVKILRNTTDITLLTEANNDSNIIKVSDTKLSLTNGIDTQETTFENNNINDMTFIHGETSVQVNSNGTLLEVPKVEVNSSNTLVVSNDAYSEIKSIKVYNNAFYDNDIFEGNPAIDTQTADIEIIDDIETFNTEKQGNFIISGFFEGQPDNTRYSIRHKYDYYELVSGIVPFYYNGIDSRYITEYQIINLDTNEVMDIPTNIYEPGSITIYIQSNLCADSNLCIRLYRRESAQFIGEYELDKSTEPYICVINNLYKNVSYDVMLFDRNTMIESRMMSDRKPE